MNPAQTLASVLAAAEAAHQQGQHARAAEILGDFRRTTELTPEQLKQLTLKQVQYLDRAGAIAAGIEALKAARQLLPQDLDLLSSEGIARSLASDFRASTELMEAAVCQRDDIAGWWDVLARNYTYLERLADAKAAGSRSLTLKDQQAPAPLGKLTYSPPPPFDASRPERNIIAYSLWGSNPRYVEGAYRNAWLVRDLYPGWTCRFYCDTTVPQRVRSTLEKLGCQLVVAQQPPRQFYEGYFWRFMVWSDPQVDRFLIRDSDSLLSVREKAAVDEWLESDRSFHVMRDFYGHTELILAGMWGGVAGRLPPIQELIAAFRPTGSVARAIDQIFLRQMVWPLIRSDVLIHDSIYTLFGARPFPPQAWCEPGFHVGQDFAATERYRNGPRLIEWFGS